MCVLWSGQWPHSIMAHDLETGKEKELYQGDVRYGSLTISPDGQRLAFTDDRALKVMPAAGGKPRVFHRLQDTEEFAPSSKSPCLAWTADGRYVLYRMRNLDQPGLTELWRVPIAGGESQKLLEMEGLSDISVHPDRRRIALTGGRIWMGEIWAMENFLILD